MHAYLNLLGPPQNLEPRYNVAPTTTIDVALPADGGRELVRMRWGLCPGWWKKTLKELPATFNARAESVHEKPMFRGAFKRTRCLIPVSGFYEWTTTPEGKQPHYITSADGAPLAIAGLWEEWRDPAGEAIKSCTLIVTGANAFMASIHDRMPVFLTLDKFDAWLSCAAGPEILQQASAGYLRSWPVSPRVNSVKNRDEALIEPLAA